MGTVCPSLPFVVTIIGPQGWSAASRHKPINK